EILNQPNLKNNDTLLTFQSYTNNIKGINETVHQIKGDKDVLKKVLTDDLKFSSLYYMARNDLDDIKTYLSYLDNQAIRLLLKSQKWFLYSFLDKGSYKAFDSFLDRLIIAKNSKAISSTDLEQSRIFKQEKDNITYSLSALTHILLAGNKEMVKKFFELNPSLEIEKFPINFYDSNSIMIRYYVEEILKSEKDLRHIKVEHLVYEISDDATKIVKTSKTKPDNFAIVDSSKKFAGYKVVDSKTGIIKNVLTLGLNLEDLETKFVKLIPKIGNSIEVTKKLISDKKIDKIVINLIVPVKFEETHKVTCILTSEGKVTYHNPNSIKDLNAQKIAKNVEEGLRIFCDKINYKIEGNISRSEIIVPNDKIGKCSLIYKYLIGSFISGNGIRPSVTEPANLGSAYFEINMIR
ncbi:MAG: hypothetical protein ACKO47_04400, partial [Alphaproteobacteria bacterium]